MMTERTPVTRRSVLVGLAGAAASALLAACGDEVANTPTAAPTVAPTGTRPATTPTAGAAATTAPTTAPATTAPTVAATTVPVTAARAATVAPTAAATASPASVAPAATATRPLATTPAQVTMGRKVAIEYWHNDAGKRGELVKRLMARFNEGNGGATVTDKVFPTYIELVQAVQASLAARIQPAVVQIGYGYLRYFADQVPHTTVEELAKRDPQGAEFLSGRNFAPGILELGRVDGVVHGMPYAMSVPVLWYNADLLKQAGIERPPATWAELRAQARQVAERTGKQGLYVAESTNFFAYQGMIESNGARVLTGMGRDARCGMNSPEAVEAMQFMQEMVREKSAVSLPQQQADQAFLGGNIGMYFTSSTVYANITMSAKFAAGSVIIPTWGAKPRRAPVGGNALFVFGRDAEQQTAAWEFIKFLHTPDAMTAWVKETGYLPTGLNLADNPMYLKSFYAETPLLKPSLEVLPDVVPWVSFPGRSGVEAEKELLDARAKILNGQDVAVTLRDATGRINQLIRG